MTAKRFYSLAPCSTYILVAKNGAQELARLEVRQTRRPGPYGYQYAARLTLSDPNTSSISSLTSGCGYNKEADAAATAWGLLCEKTRHTPDSEHRRIFSLFESGQIKRAMLSLFPGTDSSLVCT